MAKIVLGAKPKTFKPIVVTATLPDGSEGSVTMTFKYRSRTEFGEFVDRMLERARASAAEPLPEPAKKTSRRAKAPTAEPASVDIAFTFEKLHAGTSKANADYIMEIAEGWDLDVEFSHAGVARFADQFPGVVRAIMDAYHAACTEGRLGN